MQAMSTKNLKCERKHIQDIGNELKNILNSKKLQTNVSRIKNNQNTNIEAFSLNRAT